MSDFLTRYAFDEKKANGGIWEKLFGDFEVLVARLPNPAYRKRLAELLEPFTLKIEAKEFTEEQYEDLKVKALAGTVLLDWRGLDVEGQDVPFSLERAELALVEYPDFARDVANLGSRWSRFKGDNTKAAERLLGNSSNGASGTRKGGRRSSTKRG